AGTLGELVIQADRASVAQTMGGDPARAMAAPKHALQRKLLEGLRYLLKEELRLNQPGASDGWLTEDALWLVSKTVSDKLRAHLLAQGIDGIPANNTALFNVLQDHGMLQPTPDGKAIWRATVTSAAGWSHTFTLLRLAPTLIWEGASRPEPFPGTVVVEVEPRDALTEPSTDSGDSSPAVNTTPTPPLEPAADGVDALLALLRPSATESTAQAPAVEPSLAITLDEPPVSADGNDPPPGPTLPPTSYCGSSPEPPSGEH
ncbi:relaxase, partial [Pseudomonas sp. CrR25]|nr:relaxase [Pseudomonas sp. CrR25]